MSSAKTLLSLLTGRMVEFASVVEGRLQIRFVSKDGDSLTLFVEPYSKDSPEIGVSIALRVDLT